MFIRFLSTAAVIALPNWGFSQDVETSTSPAAEFLFAFGGGLKTSPTYFGSDDYEVTPDIAFGFRFLRLPGDYTFGSRDPDDEKLGFGPRGSVRVVKKRSSEDHSELEGLDDIDTSVEIGLGFGYRNRHFRAHADARYGLTGHNGWVGELAADYVARPNDKLMVTFGPRILFGNDKYASTYFGVTPSESAASRGKFTAFNASGGALSAGLDLTGHYAINDKWALIGGARWDQLLNDAADSPITKQGSADQFTVTFAVTRLFSWGF